MNKNKLKEFIGFCFKWRDGDLLTFEKGSDKMTKKKKPRIITIKKIFGQTFKFLVPISFNL